MTYFSSSCLYNCYDCICLIIVSYTLQVKLEGIMLLGQWYEIITTRVCIVRQVYAADYVSFMKDDEKLVNAIRMPSLDLWHNENI